MMIIRILLIVLQKAESQRILILLGGDKAPQSRNPTVSLLHKDPGTGRKMLKSQVTHTAKTLNLFYESFITAYSALRNPRSQSADL